ncbi:hypothetical protein [Gloeocapsa sp. PCC 73106]|uniref:hypothetical protein n=1 Tax=Gloeocapsa sp. PCC 73106 TaxID=102232 RepID=UPI0002ABCDF3|nr:hypothetical protein [Gloeocapsa sp. PCC 73106]ELR99865.1 hypothetical protein GLO73106DRAFT_00037170 [Gloeocapsa sp. PCC 73106]
MIIKVKLIQKNKLMTSLPVIFRSEFNNFQSLNANQAWSLFFTAGNEDKNLGFNPKTGRIFTYLLIAIVVVGSFGKIIFTQLN